MKRPFYLHALLVIVLCCAPLPIRAQQPQDCNELKKAIAAVQEQMRSKTLSASTQTLYEETLKKLRRQYSECLEREIATVSDLLKVVANTDAAMDVDARLRSLKREKDELDKGLAGSPQLASNRTRLAAPPSTQSAADNNGTGDNNLVASPPAPVASPTPIAAVCPPTVPYTDAPDILKDIVARSAADVVAQSANPATAATAPDFAIVAGPQIVLYTVFDSASPKSSQLVRDLEAYHYLGETARTDKQLGSAANSNGAVSAIEKPGFAQLLGFAIEHGGITKKNDGTNLTLSTSLYSLYTLGNKDTAERYSRAGILNRLSAAATFAIQDQNNDLANFRRNNLTEWSAKLRLYGDRSTRSPEFRRFFDEKIKPAIRDRLRSLGRSIDVLATSIKAYDRMEGAALDPLPGIVAARMQCADYKSAATAQKEKIIADLILSQLRTTVYEPVKSGTIGLTAQDVARIEAEFLPNLKRSLDNLVLADKALKDEITNLQKGPLATFAYTNYRIPTGSDYSETKLLFEQERGFMGPLKLTGNAGVSFYNRPDPLLNQERVRDVSAALSFEGSSRSPFTEAENESRITYSFVGRYQRLFENRRAVNRTPDIGTFQFVMEIPFFKGLSLPLSATYANATEEEKKNRLRFNFGMRLDTDKLFEILRAASNH